MVTLSYMGESYLKKGFHFNQNVDVTVIGVTCYMLLWHQWLVLHAYSCDTSNMAVQLIVTYNMIPFSFLTTICSFNLSETIHIQRVFLKMNSM